ncbi:MAG TPA: hypothetical protein PK156_42490, partial [Polyangium sp.]|nr:hypothetical protein [Polyangium sp.]
MDRIPTIFIAFGAAAGAAWFFISSAQGASVRLGGLGDAIKAAARGKKPAIPEGVTGELADVYDEVARLAKLSSERESEIKKLEEGGGASAVNVDEVIDAMQRAANGERVRAPKGTKPEMVPLYEELSNVSEAIRDASNSAEKKTLVAEERARSAEQKAQAAEQRLSSIEQRISSAEQRAMMAEQSLGSAEQRLHQAEQRAAMAEQRETQNRGDVAELLASFELDIVEGIQRALTGERVRPPSGAKPEVARIFMEIAGIGERLSAADQRDNQRKAELADTMRMLEGELVDAVQRVGAGERVRPPAGAKPEVARIF